MSEIFRNIPELASVDLNLCFSCKSVKLACGLSRCPFLKAFDAIKAPDVTTTLSASNSLFGPSPQIFVGEAGYPNVFSGPMTSLSEDSNLAQLAANPTAWTNRSFEEILQLRFGLIRGMKRTTTRVIEAKNIDERILSGMQEVAMATNPIDVESTFTGKIQTNVSIDGISQPQGPSGTITKLDIAEHARVPTVVERTINDELKAAEQIQQLYQSGLDVYYLQNLLSAGLTGKEYAAKLVPTRWSITATDDIIGKQLIVELQSFPVVQQITLLEGNFFGNYFTIILFPKQWAFENFEAWAPKTVFTLANTQYSVSQDSEGLKVSERYKGKSKYSNQAGGYYAARLSILSYLHKIHRQAKVISIREITPEYIVPAGVWVVREAARIATEAKPKYFNSRQELELYLQSKLRVPLEVYFQKSKIFGQKNLLDFL